MSKSYADILGTAMQLIGKRVLLHWLDENGEACGTFGTLTHVWPEEGKDAVLGPRPKRVQLENNYACVDIKRITRIEPYSR